MILADDDAELREELRRLLEDHGQVTVVGEAANGRELIDLVDRSHPDGILLDLSMPDMDGFGVLSVLALRPRSVPTVVLTLHDDAARVDRALALGASGYVLKSARPDVIVTALRAALEGGTFIQPTVARELLARHVLVTAGAAGSDRFTPRQHQLLRALANGLSNKDIAYQLGIAEETVKGYLKDLYARTGVASRAGAVAWAMRRGVID